jgi:hypothetical protein
MPPDGVHAGFDTLVGLDTTRAPALAAVIVAGGHAKGLGGVNKGVRVVPDQIHARLTRVEYEASTLPAGVCVAKCGVGNDRTFVNVNTPHDYERATGLIEWKPESPQDRITTGRTRPMTDADS